MITANSCVCVCVCMYARVHEFPREKRKKRARVASLLPSSRNPDFEKSCKLVGTHFCSIRQVELDVSCINAYISLTNGLSKKEGKKRERERENERRLSNTERIRESSSSFSRNKQFQICPVRFLYSSFFFFSSTEYRIIFLRKKVERIR